jgi:hypothetical protein
MRALLFSMLILLSACAVASPYSESGWTGGFEDRQINIETFEVSYYVNGYTSEETVQTYWLHHAAELTLSHGFDGFEILGNVRLTQARPGEARVVPVVINDFGKPYMVARIRFLRGPLIESPGRIFNAQALKDFLEPYVRGQTCGTNVCPHVHRYLLPGFGQAAPAPPS